MSTAQKVTLRFFFVSAQDAAYRPVGERSSEPPSSQSDTCWSASAQRVGRCGPEIRPGAAEPTLNLPPFTGHLKSARSEKGWPYGKAQKSEALQP